MVGGIAKELRGLIYYTHNEVLVKNRNPPRAVDSDVGNWYICQS